MNLNTEPKIISMANSLDLDAESPVDSIKKFCHERVAKFLRRGGQITNVGELQELVCERLNLEVKEIWNDEDLERYAAKYCAEREIGVYGAIKSQLKPDTFGMLTQLERRTPKGKVQFVAFIDCRGEKYLRRIFTLWHEIAHGLTTMDQLALPLRRSTEELIEKDPIEKLTDMIAADFAFYKPLFQPILNAELKKEGRLTFQVVERVRNRFNPDASFASTLSACAKMAPLPVILLEAGPKLKKEEQRLIDSGVASVTDFQPSLRVLQSWSNELARFQLPHVPKQYRVPTESAIAKVYASDRSTVSRPGLSRENLGNWTTSAGARLPNAPVTIEARKVGGLVVALIALAS